MSETDQDRIVGSIARKLMWVLVPFLLMGVGLQVKAYFDVNNKVSKEAFWEVQANLTLLVEKKTRALESLVLANTGDIKHIEQNLSELKKIQKEIDKFLRDSYRVRGYNSPLSEY